MGYALPPSTSPSHKSFAFMQILFSMLLFYAWTSGLRQCRRYIQRGLHPLNLSKCLAESAAITSPLIPWNTCGIVMFAITAIIFNTTLLTTVVSTKDPSVFTIFKIFPIKIRNVPVASKMHRNGGAPPLEDALRYFISCADTAGDQTSRHKRGA